MDTLLSSIELLARWDVFAALLIGSIGGVLVGSMPGVGAAVAIAIVLPVTFSLEPIVGLTALLGIYGSSMFGGAIPAILVTADRTAEVRSEADRAGIDLLNKPVKPAALRAALSRIASLGKAAAE